MSTIKEVERTRAEAYEEMLKEALSRPGVREVMEVYQNRRKAASGLDAYRKASKPRAKITTSDRTTDM